MPWKVLVTDAANPDVAHIVMLAAQRGVPAEEVPDLLCTAIGLIHPHYTRGATGDDGTGVGA